jgi:four helix bundle protein
LPVYQKAMEFWRAVTATLQSPALRRDRALHAQISSANDSITANMHEGFEQSTDKAFASFLTHSKASLAEVLARLEQAHLKHGIPEDQLHDCRAKGDELGKMLGGFIKYLLNCNWKERGRYKLTNHDS